VGVDAPGTTSYFGLAWILKKNGLTMKDITIATMSPQAAAQAFVAGQNDAAMTYEPYLSAVRDKPDSGKIIATTLDYPMVMDTMGCTPKSSAITRRPCRRWSTATSEAVEMIKKDPAKSYEIMGADVKQTASSSRSRRLSAGRTRRRTRNSSPAKYSSSAGKRRTSCSRSASSRQSPTST